MNLIEVLRHECISINDNIAGTDELLKIISATAKKSPVLESLNEEAIFNALKAREELGSTAFGGGIAIPHCRLSSVKDYVVGAVVIKEGVKFNALDNEPVKLFIFIIAPDNNSNQHVRILSAISQLLRIKGAYEEITAANSSEALLESILRYSQDETKPADDKPRMLLNIFLQNEEFLSGILEVFSAMETSSSMVLEANDSSSYLANTPLFAGFLSDSDRRFNRIIKAVVDKDLTNETIRRIEQLTGHLAERNDIMVTVQETFYVAGSIDF
ncbi:MAG: PTS sugar transporter subunit IIA [Planctomycetota bacterium]|jgi:PTS system nitrogen regulatory IIA component